MSHILRKNREILPIFFSKFSLEFKQGRNSPNMIAYSMQYLPRNILIMLKCFQYSSLFQKIHPQLQNFDDYVTPYDVIGHYVIGHPDIRTETFGLGVNRVENRLIIGGLQ